MAMQGGSPAPQRQSGARSCLPVLGVIAVMLALGYGASLLFGDDGGSSSSAKPPSSSSSSASPDTSGASDGKGGSWEVGDCGGPDPDRQPDGFKAYDCDDSAATFKALEIQPASFLPNSVRCPAGTDLIIQVSVKFGSSGDDDKGGIPSKTVCGRNLSDDHPGDAGAGGGQLVKGDCVTSTAKEVPCASGGPDAFKVLDLVKTQDECPSGTTEPMRLTIAVGRPYDVICAGPS